MIKFLKEELENEDSPVNDTFVRICVGGIILVVGGYFYYQYLFHLTHHVQKRGKITATAPAAPSQPDPVLVVPTPAATPSPSAVPVSDPAATPAPVRNANNTSFASASESSSQEESSQARVMSIDIKAPVTAQARATGSSAIRMPSVTVKVDRPLTDAEKIEQAAETGFSRVMNYAQNYPDEYGFAPDEGLDQAKLGEAIPVYTITATNRHSYQEGQPVKPLLQPTGDLIFPITYNGEIRYMVQVKKTSKGYVAGDGSKALALVYEKILTTWPASGGYHPQLVVQKGIPDYYFTIPELPDPNLTDTSCMFQETPVLSPASVILASWR